MSEHNKHHSVIFRDSGFLMKGTGGPLSFAVSSLREETLSLMMLGVNVWHHSELQTSFPDLSELSDLSEQTDFPIMFV